MLLHPQGLGGGSFDLRKAIVHFGHPSEIHFEEIGGN